MIIKYILTIILIVLFFLTKAQKDSTILGAEFVYGMSELDQISSFMQNFPGERGSFVSAIDKAIVPLKIIVSPKGEIESVLSNGFISIEYRWARRQFSEEYYKKYCLTQAQAIVKFTEGLWIPADKDGQAIYDTILHSLIFQWKDKKSYSSLYDFERESDEINFLFTPKLDSIKGFYNNPFLLLFNSRPNKNIHTESAAVMYYNFALEKLKQKKFYIAERMFKLSYSKNPNNDCLYNLTVSQINLGWKKDACLNLNKLLNNGDEEAIGLIKQYCK